MRTPRGLWFILPSLLLVSCTEPVSNSESVGTASSALATSSGTLNSSVRPLFWNGTVTTAPPIGNQPDVCSTVACSRFDLTIDLPNATFRHRDGGVQVAVRWPTTDNAVNLYVYSSSGPSGDVQIGSSTGILASRSDSLVLRRPRNGKYIVYVALDPANSLAASVNFEALAMVQYDPPIQPVRPLRPDLEVAFPANVTFETPSFPFFGEPDPPAGETCFGSEKREDGANVCLRFDQTLANVGDGPFELRFAVPHDPTDPSTNVVQRTYFSDNPAHSEDAFAGNWQFDADEGGEYEFTGFAQSKLWKADARGRRLGLLPVRSSNKIAFCMEDTGIFKWGLEGVGPRTFHAPDCLVFQESDARYNYLIQGITKGWSDTYDWFLPGQYVEVSGLADGYYVLDTVADPTGVVRESDESNNCGSVLVRLSGVDTPGRRVDVLGPATPCSYPPPHHLAGTTDTELSAFLKGLSFFEEKESVEDGLGPIYNETSCAACHAVGGTGGGSERVETLFGRSAGGVFDPLTALGGVLRADHAIGRTSPDCNFEPETIPTAANVVADRRTQPLFGLGLVDAVPDATFLAIAEAERQRDPSTAGRVSTGIDLASGRTVVAKFGWKAQETSLLQFVGRAYLNEMGITNPLFPTEACPNGDCDLVARCNPVPAVNDPSLATLATFADFMKFLAPVPREASCGEVNDGERVFGQIGCDSCHRSTLTTGPNSSAALNRVTFHPYSDFLLHDFGAAADQIAEGVAGPREMRTQPLWGLRYVTTLLHDGRAHSIEEAIEGHGGQAAAAGRAFRDLSPRQRRQLLSFLESL